MTDSKRSGEPPQLHIWDASTREIELGTLVDGDEHWTLVVVAERASPDLCRGRVSFRRENERFDTEAVLLEETEEALVRRASELPASTLRQLLRSLKN